MAMLKRALKEISMGNMWLAESDGGKITVGSKDNNKCYIEFLPSGTYDVWCPETKNRRK